MTSVRDEPMQVAVESAGIRVVTTSTQGPTGPATVAAGSVVTVEGDLVIGGTSGTPIALPKGGAGNVLRMGHGNRPVWFDDYIFVDALGVSTANTGAQNKTALDAIIAGLTRNVGHKAVIFGSVGTYDVTGSILWNMDLITIVGQGRDATYIEQQTANVPTFKWDDADASHTQGVVIADLALSNANTPTNLTTQQWAVQFRADPAGTSASSLSYYNCRFENLRFTKVHTGIGHWTDTGGQCAIWGTVFRHITADDITGPIITLASTVAAGQPHVTIEDISILNYNGIVNTTGTYAINISACSGLTLKAINIEKWVGPAISITGSAAGASIDGLRVEWHKFTAANDYLVLIANGNFSIRNTAISFETLDGGLPQSIFWLASTGMQLRVEEIQVETIDATPTGIMQLFRTDESNKINLWGLNNSIPAVLSEYLPAAWGEGGRLARVSVDGMAPTIDDLTGTASAIFENRAFTILASGGVPTKTYKCGRNAAGTWVWNTTWTAT